MLALAKTEPRASSVPLAAKATRVSVTWPCGPANGIKAFTGREWDPETGLYYYRARYYDAKVGRFISEDPIGFDGGVNLYAYVYDNPVIFTDPTGLDAAAVCCDGKGGYRVCWLQNVESALLRGCLVTHEEDHGDFIKTKCGPNQCANKPDGYRTFTMTMQLPRGARQSGPGAIRHRPARQSHDDDVRAHRRAQDDDRSHGPHDVVPVRRDGPQDEGD